MKKILLPLLFLSIALTGRIHAEIREQALEYTAGGVTCEGWRVFDDAKTGKQPGVLIIHQWTGLTDYEKMRARMLANLGYTVFAADVYGKGVRPQPPASGQEAGKYKKDRPLFRERMKAALDVLRKDEHADPQRLAAIGYCFGGTGVLELARSGAGLKGVVSFHGGLDSPTPDDGKNIRARVLVLHGADDATIAAKDFAAFENEMKSASVDYKIIQYPGAVHAFTQKMAGNDKSKGVAYNAEADAKSWEAMKNFFSEVFK